jgi:hypothetical protein
MKNMSMRLLLLVWLLAGAAWAGNSFTIAVVPDTQLEVLDGKDTRLANRFQWLIAHRAALNLQCVLQSGDLVNWDTADHFQYERASAAAKLLDEARLPYIFALGNHDTWATGGTPEKPGGSARPGNVHDNLRNTAVYNQYFPLKRFTLLGGVFEPGKIDNAWHTFQAGGHDWLVINLELWARSNAVAWAKTVADQHPAHNVILLTHSFLTNGKTIEQRNGGYGDNSPQYIFDHLVAPSPNFRLVFCGHTGAHGYRLDRGAAGNEIHEFLQTYHDPVTNPVRLFTIDTQAGTIQTRVVCPSLGQDKADGSTLEIKGVQWMPAAARP